MQFPNMNIVKNKTEYHSVQVARKDYTYHKIRARNPEERLWSPKTKNLVKRSRTNFVYTYNIRT